MKSYIQLISTHLPETFPSLLLHFDKARYLINCPEGTQRLCSTQSIKLSKLNTLLFTHLTWRNFGGLPGMLLTLTDSGVTSVKLAGCGVEDALSNCQNFVYRENVDVAVVEFSESEESTSSSSENGSSLVLDGFKDENITVIPIIVPHGEHTTSKKRKFENSISNEQSILKKAILSRMFPNKPAKINAEKASHTEPTLDVPQTPNISNMYIAESSISNLVQIKKDVIQYSPSAAVSMAGTRVKSANPPPLLSYIIRGPTIPGKFKPEIAKSMGLKPGPHFKTLISGTPVLSPTGILVQPSDCVDPPREGFMILVVDIPSKDYIRGLKERVTKEWAKLQVFEKCLVVFWNLRVDEEEIKSVCDMFQIAKHVINVPSKSAPPIFHSYTDFKHELNSINSSIFPIPYYNSLSPPSSTIKNGIVGASLLTVDLEPKFDVKLETSIPQYKPPTSNVSVAAVQADTKQKLWDRDDISLITLGTGSAIPSTYRNVSSTMVLFPSVPSTEDSTSRKAPGMSMLFDSGESTLGQIKRHFGDQYQSVLKNLKLLFISHLHADHHLGCISVIREWNELNRVNIGNGSEMGNEDKLVIICPSNFYSFLLDYQSQVEKFGLENCDVRVSKHEECFDVNSSEWMVQLRSVAVDHCFDSYGAVVVARAKALGIDNGDLKSDFEIDHTRTFKIVYSGDCRPTPALISHGRNATILIHEATLSDLKKAEAKMKKHTTMTECVQVGEEMLAKNLVMTHFSQRYSKFPDLDSYGLLDLIEERNNQAGDEKMKIAVAFDMMQIGIKDFKSFGKIARKLSDLYSEPEFD
ncbi:hypothetical protein HK098_003207 [Nowakowskiella sp. JEL0407]|nr:hypothetical protein HK098_003207 [Nowakowskiella sp. JEL0407]